MLWSLLPLSCSSQAWLSQWPQALTCSCPAAIQQCWAPSILGGLYSFEVLWVALIFSHLCSKHLPHFEQNGALQGLGSAALGICTRLTGTSGKSDPFSSPSGLHWDSFEGTGTITECNYVYKREWNSSVLLIISSCLVFACSMLHNYSLLQKRQSYCSVLSHSYLYLVITLLRIKGRVWNQSCTIRTKTQLLGPFCSKAVTNVTTSLLFSLLDYSPTIPQPDGLYSVYLSLIQSKRSPCLWGHPSHFQH